MKHRRWLLLEGTFKCMYEYFPVNTEHNYWQSFSVKWNFIFCNIKSLSARRTAIKMEALRVLQNVVFGQEKLKLKNERVCWDRCSQVRCLKLQSILNATEEVRYFCGMCCVLGTGIKDNSQQQCFYGAFVISF